MLEDDGRVLTARAAKGLEEVERGVRIPVGRPAGSRGGSRRIMASMRIADVDHAEILSPILREKGSSRCWGAPLVVEGAHV